MDCPRLVQHLENGTIPTSKRAFDVCYKIAQVFTSFHLHKMEHGGEKMQLFVLNMTSRHFVEVKRMHMVWSVKCAIDGFMEDDPVTPALKTKGYQAYELDGDIALYATNRALENYPCPACHEGYVCQINMQRCRLSHQSGGTLQMMDQDDLIQFWDGLSIQKRKELVKVAEDYIKGVGRSLLKLRQELKTLVLACAGVVDVSGETLMISLHEASEGTHLFRVRKRTSLKVVISDPLDYIACMADALVTKMATSRAEQRQQMLIEQEEAEFTRVERKKNKKTRKQYLRWVEDQIFSKKQYPSEQRWADLIE